MPFFVGQLVMVLSGLAVEIFHFFRVLLDSPVYEIY